MFLKCAAAADKCDRIYLDFPVQHSDRRIESIPYLQKQWILRSASVLIVCAAEEV
jgi:hypothetical protein